ncbi:hypothetical protein CL616_03750 [archaeon]|nr:hypothetical protein [archaeon]
MKFYKIFIYLIIVIISFDIVIANHLETSKSEPSTIRTINNPNDLEDYCNSMGFCSISDKKVNLDMEMVLSSLSSKKISSDELVNFIKLYTDSVDFNKLKNKQFLDLIEGTKIKLDKNSYKTQSTSKLFSITKFVEEFERRIVKDPEILNQNEEVLKKWLSFYHIKLNGINDLSKIKVENLKITPKGKHSVLFSFCKTKSKNEIDCKSMKSRVVLEYLYELGETFDFVELSDKEIKISSFIIPLNLESKKDLIEEICDSLECYFVINSDYLTLDSTNSDSFGSGKVKFSKFKLSYESFHSVNIFYNDFRIKPANDFKPITLYLDGTINLNEFKMYKKRNNRYLKINHIIGLNLKIGDCESTSSAEICMSGNNLDEIVLHNDKPSAFFNTFRKIKSMKLISSEGDTIVQTTINKKVQFIKIKDGKVGYSPDFFSNIYSIQLFDGKNKNIMSYSGGVVECDKCSRTNLGSFSDKVISHNAGFSYNEKLRIKKELIDKYCIDPLKCKESELAPRDFTGIIDGHNEESLINVFQQVSDKTGVGIYEIAELFCIESFCDEKTMSEYYKTGTTDIEFDSFKMYFLDDLNDLMIVELKDKGYLSHDIKSIRLSKNGYPIYKNYFEGMTVIASYYKFMKDLAKSDFEEGKKKGLIPTNMELTPNKKSAVDYYYFNCGRGAGKAMLYGDEYKSPSDKNQRVKGFGIGNFFNKFQLIKSKKQGEVLVYSPNQCKINAFTFMMSIELAKRINALSPPF